MGLLSLFLLSVLSVSAEETNTWFYPESKTPHAYALMIHGFNLKPSKMDELAKVFTDNQIAVLRVALTGHQGKPNEMQSISVDAYQRDFKAAYQELKTKAGRAPIYLVGYSLGALLSAHEWAKRELPDVKGAIFFAPPIVTRESAQKILKVPSPTIPSFSKPGWVAHRFTSRKGYQALFELQESFHAMKNDKINKPTLVFMKEKDEFIDFKGTQTWIEESKLNDWKVISLPRKENLKLTDRMYDHLMIAESVAGKEAWKSVKQEIEAFFKH